MASDLAGLALLAARLGDERLQRRLARERAYERRVARERRYFLHPESWRGLIHGSVRLAGLHARGRRNARAIELRRNELSFGHLPAVFDGFTLLQLSDLHLDLNPDIVDVLIERVRPLEYDLCLLTGDYRARTDGPFDATLAALERLRGHLRGPAYAVLGNHDTIRMVPRMEAMGFSLLLDEWTRIERDDASLCLAGIDDARSGRAENIRRATQGMPDRVVSILLSHRPGAYRHAAQAGFSLMLSGHTHGGQICLPGGTPLFTDGESPRALARGAWRYHSLLGYTSAGSGASLVDLRFNCPPEVTLHRLRREGGTTPPAIP
jgi:uncharacterized protein